MEKNRKYWRRSIFNIPRWIGWEGLHANASNIKNMYSNILRNVNTPQQNVETFAEAVERLGLTDQDLVNLKQGFYQRSVLYLCLLIFGFLYNLYLMFYNFWGAALVMFSINSMLFSFWFREHFWYTQVRMRRLGLKFREWFKLCFYI